MKRLLLSLLVVAATLTASAQFRFGLQTGLNVNEFHFNSSTLSSSNRMGFNVGAIVEFTVPVTGWGFDAGIRYVRRNSRWVTENESYSDNRDYLEIPVNLKWKINVPVLNAIARPFLTTGPSFSFLTSRSLSDTYTNRKFDTAWNFGFGLELFRKVQLGASYGLGLTKAMKTIGATSTASIHGRNRYWTVTAAYLF